MANIPNITTLRRNPIIPEAEDVKDVVDESHDILKPIKKLEPLTGDHYPKPPFLPQTIKPAEQKSSDGLKPQLDELKIANETADDQLVALEEISNKLDVLADTLRLKTSGIIDSLSAASVLADRVEAKDTSTQTSELPSLTTTDPKPSNDLLNKSDSTSQTVKGAPNKGGNPVLAAIGTMSGIVKAGFTKTIDGSNKLFSMLFNYSLSQIAQAAKVAAALLAIVVGIDIIRAAWQKWGQDILAAFESFSTVVAEWWDGFTEFLSTFTDLKSAFESMSGSFMAIKNAWETGDWPALAASIGSAIITGLKTLEAVLGRVMTGALSKLLSMLGFKDAAKTVEAEGLQRYQNLTNNRLSDENQRKLAEEQIRREKNDGKTPTQRGVTSFLPDTWRKKIGFISDGEYDQIQAEKKDKAARDALSDEDKINNVAAANEAREAIARFRDVAENVNLNNQAQVAKFDKYKNEAQKYVNSAALAKTPKIKAELQSQLNSISKLVNPKASVKPSKSADSKDTQVARNINKAEARKSAVTASNTTNNLNSTIVKSNNNVSVKVPITSTRAPGVFGATGVN